MKLTFPMVAVLSIILFMFSCSSEDNPSSTDGDSVDGDSELSENAEEDGELIERDLLAVEVSDEQELIGGPDAGGRVGDFLLRNDKIRFIVQGAGPARSWVPYGGSVIDADILREGDGYDMLDEISPITTFIKSFKPEKVEIVDDGQSGEKAHVRATGIVAGIPIVDFALPLSCDQMAVTLDYVLVPGANYIEITTTVHPEVKSDIAMGDGIVWSNRLSILTPGFGWGVSGLASFGEFDLQIAVSTEEDNNGKSIAYGFMAKDGALSIATDLADILPYMGFGEDHVAAGQTRSYTRYFIVAETVSDIYKTYSELRESSLGDITVTVAVADEADAEEVFDLEAVDANGKTAGFAHAVVGENTLSLPAGTYTLRIGGKGRVWTEDSQSITVAAEEPAQAALSVPATGRVSFIVGGDHFDGSVKDRLPARISLQSGLDADIAASIRRRVYTASGEGSFLIEPGDYTITVSRGYEYEVCRESASIAAGDTYNVDCSLQRSVDTTGWVAGDLHMHTERSIDAVVAVEQRIIQMAAVGLERSPITDHDVVSDLDPYVDGLGLREFITLIAGDEVSPVAAHTNGFPLSLREDRNTYFGVQWYGDYDDTSCTLKDNPPYPDIWAQLREEYDAGIVQINHPRSNSQGFLNTFKYDPLVGLDSFEEGDFDLNWDAIELINAGDVDDALTATLADWFSFFNQGVHKAGTAVSDCHTNDCPGDARSFIRTEEDDPSLVTEEMFVDAIKNLRVQAASGPFVTATIGDAKIGDTAELGGNGNVELHVKVQAPSWMPVDWIRVVVNGDIVATVEADQLQDAVVRYDASFSLTVDKDSWFVVLAGAPLKRLAPVSPGQPVLTITNPIFVDLNDDGYEAPGLPDANHAAASFEELAALAGGSK